MNKDQFLNGLYNELTALTEAERQKSIDYYAEMLDDRIEDGMSEEEAVSAIGTPQEIAKEVLLNQPLHTLIKTKVKKAHKLRGWEIAMLIIGSPMWMPLLIAAGAVLLSLYLVLWSVIVSLWSVFISFIGCAIGGIIGGFVFSFCGNISSGIAMMGAGIVCAGLSIFLFYGCKAVTKGIILLTKKIALGIKSSFIKKEEA